MKRTISGPGASDFLTAGGGEDLPGGGSKGTGELREDTEITNPRNLVPQLAPEDDPANEAQSGRRADQQDDNLHGSQTGNIGGGGPNSDRPNPART